MLLLFKENIQKEIAYGLFISPIPSIVIIKHYLETSKIIAVVGYLQPKTRPVIVLARRCRAGLSDYSC